MLDNADDYFYNNNGNNNNNNNNNSGAPWVTKFGKVSIRENLVMT